GSASYRSANEPSVHTLATIRANLRRSSSESTYTPSAMIILLASRRLRGRRTNGSGERASGLSATPVLDGRAIEHVHRAAGATGPDSHVRNEPHMTTVMCGAVDDPQW